MRAPLVSSTKQSTVVAELKAIIKQAPLHLREVMRRSNFSNATPSQILEVIADDYPHILNMVKA